MSDKLIWLDLETTGLDPKVDQILEIGVIVTDRQLNTIWEYSGTIGATLKELEKMNDYVTDMHTQSGLIEHCLVSPATVEGTENRLLGLLKLKVEPNTSPICGNSVHFDRAFLKQHMPELEKFFHYRNLDVSSLQIVADMIDPNINKRLGKVKPHRALDDLKNSIKQLKFYMNLVTTGEMI